MDSVRENNSGRSRGGAMGAIALQWILTKRPGVYAYPKHPVLLLPSGPDKVWALRSRKSGSFITLA